MSLAKISRSDQGILIQCLCIGLIVATVVGPAMAQSTRPSTTPPAQLTQRQKADRLLNYLEADYVKKSQSLDWVARGLGVISLARSPRATAMAKLFDILEKDQENVVRLLAWQAIMARAADLDEHAYNRWMNATWKLADKGAFNGSLRIALLKAMAIAPPTDTAKKMFSLFFSQTNAWEAQDIATLDAMGECLAAWHSGPLAQALILRMSDVNDAVRAEYVLHAAGCSASWAKSLLPPNAWDPHSTDRKHPSWTDVWKQAQIQYAQWLRANVDHWRESSRMVGMPWKKLKPLYVQPPVAIEKIDEKDPMWREDLESGRVKLDEFEVVFVVDATGSMGDVLEWLKRDVGKMMAAFAMVSKEPRIGITFYRDFDCTFVVKHVPLSDHLEKLMPALKAMTADGGGDIPEAVREGLQDAIRNNKWSERKQGASRVLMLIGDAPPHPETISDCIELARKAAATGLHTYALRVTTDEGHNDLSSFTKIAEAGGGIAVDADFPRIAKIRFLDGAGHDIPLQTIERPETQFLVAMRAPAERPAEKILIKLLTDAINPEYKDRVEPLVRTLLAFTEQPTPKEVRRGFSANTETMGTAQFHPQ